MKQKTPQTFAITFLVILLIGAYLYLTKENAVAPITSTTTSTPVRNSANTYTNITYGITFTYPSFYSIQETTLTDSQTGTGLLITLLEKDITTPLNAEGPTAITLAIYDNAANKISNGDPLETWIKTSPNSNFKLSNLPEAEMTTIDSQNARTYTWDGLYQGKSYVIARFGHIYMFSVTYQGEADTEKRNDLTAILNTVHISKTPKTN